MILCLCKLHFLCIFNYLPSWDHLCDVLELCLRNNQYKHFDLPWKPKTYCLYHYLSCMHRDYIVFSDWNKANSHSFVYRSRRTCTLWRYQFCFASVIIYKVASKERHRKRTWRIINFLVGFGEKARSKK